MKRVMVKSVHDAFEYVMEHYYPNGLEEMVQRKDTYAVISIQDTHTGGFGLEFRPTQFCKGVLTLYFDDVFCEVEGAQAFTEEMAAQVIDFVQAQRKQVDTLLVHCYAGRSRSMAVGAFAVKLLGGDNHRYFETTSLNMLVYDTLERVWQRRQAQY